MNKKHIITITRQYGSGGHEIGKLLADKLGISFYDKELISLAAKESGIAPEVFETVDERPTNSLLYSLSTGMYTYGNGFAMMGDLPMNDKLYILQHKIIREKAKNESFVVVGRCADYVLREFTDVTKVFIYADLNSRIRRAIARNDIDPSRAKQAVIRTDKNRANYYSFYSGQKWGLPENYDLCVNSTNLAADQVSDLIISYLNMTDTE